MSQTTERSPVGRVVLGSLYKGNTTDAENKPLLVKNGPNQGQPRVNFFFAVAIPKTGEQSWTQTPWGQKIYQIAAAAFPQAVKTPTFAWKIEDGDSTIPNKRGRKPCENEGWPGHWIMKFSGGYPPKVYVSENGGWRQETTPDFVKPGYFVEVGYTCAGNGSQSQPGIYLNHQMVAFRGYGQEIVFGPSPDEIGFGAAPLPAGASAVPLAGSAPLPGAVPPVNPTVAAPAAVPAVPVTAAIPATLPIPTTTTISPSKVMTGKAGGATYEQFVAQGWTDEKMIADGYLTPPVAAPSPIPIVPNPAFLQVPLANPSQGVAPATGAAVVPAPGPIAPVSTMTTSPSKRMTAKAGTATYEQFIANGWTDEKMIADGYLEL